mmetsp:Transcript_88511/g.202519  ORF Transcript_88511/g.202519 Transcript_88511/m.202519 type:complete len:218 (-) Transcript_88511:644-1297(-)
MKRVAVPTLAALVFHPRPLNCNAILEVLSICRHFQVAWSMAIRMAARRRAQCGMPGRTPFQSGVAELPSHAMKIFRVLAVQGFFRAGFPNRDGDLVKLGPLQLHVPMLLQALHSVPLDVLFQLVPLFEHSGAHRGHRRYLDEKSPHIRRCITTPLHKLLLHMRAHHFLLVTASIPPQRIWIVDVHLALVTHIVKQDFVQMRLSKIAADLTLAVRKDH